MYYLDAYFRERDWPRIGRTLGGIYALALVIGCFGVGNMFQSNQAYQQMLVITGGESSFLADYSLLFGLVLATIVGLVIIGGIKRIAAVTSKLVPFMAAAYGIGALAVIASNLEFVGPAFVSVFRDAFSGSAAAGGFLGASFAYAFNRGVNRGLCSNEAGQGSAPIAHASAKGREPVSEGFVAILEPFIDTILICTLTGLVILSSGVWNEKFPNDFQDSDTIILAGDLTDSDAQHVTALSAFLTDQPSSVQRYSGTIEVQNGEATHEGFTILHARSVAENVTYHIG